MNKTIAAVLATATMSAGIVVAAGVGPASAAPYPGSVTTITHANAPEKVVRGSSARVCGVVKMQGSGRSIPADGTITLTVTNAAGYSQTITKTYKGHRTCGFVGPLNARGSYTLTASYTPSTGSVFKPSSDDDTFSVVGRAA